MEDFSGPDRRTLPNKSLSLLVNVGGTCRETLGENAAKIFFLSHHVPSTVAVRVLFHRERRRDTEIEIAARDASDTYPRDKK